MIKADAVEQVVTVEPAPTTATRPVRSKARLPKRLRTFLIFAVPSVVVAGLFLVWLIPGRLTGTNEDLATYTVRRSNLTISVTESGNLKARNAVDIKSQVERRTTIISIVPEGTYITEEDVKNGKILVELDNAELKEQFTQQEITFESAKASYAEAEGAYEIQKKQNESDITKGELTLRFAEMDLKKYLGEKLAEELIRNSENKSDPIADIGKLVNSKDLGGSASQKLKELQTKIDLAHEEHKRAQTRADWTRKLYEKEYVPLADLEADELAVERKKVEWEQAQTALRLFKRYEFPKEAAKCYSDYEEAKRELERIYARARSKLAQAQAKLKGQEAAYNLQKDRLEKLKKQLDACVIRAPAPGQVVYASSTSRWARRNRPIEQGAEVHHRMKILELPNTAEMKVETKVHEVWVDKVRPGQFAKITVDAFPDENFSGKVLKVAPLADPQRWWANPDHKVYLTEVSIDGTNNRLRTGMSAKVEILIKKLENVLIVPVQTVINRSGTKVVYVDNNGQPEAREVTTGEFNDNFIEIKSGLKVGEKVLLTPPRPHEEGKPKEPEPSATTKPTTQPKREDKKSVTSSKPQPDGQKTGK